MIGSFEVCKFPPAQRQRGQPPPGVVKAIQPRRRAANLKRFSIGKASLIVEGGWKTWLFSDNKLWTLQERMCHELVSRCQLAILLRTSRLTQNSACTSQCQPQIINAWDQNHQKFQSINKYPKNQSQFHDQNFIFLNSIFFKMTTIGCSVCRWQFGVSKIPWAQWHLAKALAVGPRAVHDFGAAPFGREQWWCSIGGKWGTFKLFLGCF